MACGRSDRPPPQALGRSSALPLVHRTCPPSWGRSAPDRNCPGQAPQRRECLASESRGQGRSAHRRAVAVVLSRGLPRQHSFSGWRHVPAVGDGRGGDSRIAKGTCGAAEQVPCQIAKATSG
jgi:hypothetical protein